MLGEVLGLLLGKKAGRGDRDRAWASAGECTMQQAGAIVVLGQVLG